MWKSNCLFCCCELWLTSFQQPRPHLLDQETTETEPVRQGEVSQQLGNKALNIHQPGKGYQVISKDAEESQWGTWNNSDPPRRGRPTETAKEGKRPQLMSVFMIQP